MEPARNIRHRELDIRRGYGHRVFYAACVFEKRGCYCAYALAADSGFRSEHRLYSDRVHFLVLTGRDGDKITLNDPNSPTNSQKSWDYDTLAGQIQSLWVLRRAG